MDNFTFHNPTTLYFGKGQIEKLDDAVPRDGKTLLLYGKGSIMSNGVYNQVKRALGNRTVLEYGGIEANPLYETLMPAAQLAREEKVTFLLSVGGGSVLDGTKFVAAAAQFEGEPWDILSNGAAPESALPIGAVLTLPATGSEMNGNAVISREETREKLPFSSPLVYPVFSVLDPETTLSLPKRQVANGVVDSFVHVMEQYMTFPNSAPLQDRLAESILKTLVEEGPKTLAKPTDYESRANLCWAATLALNGLINRGVPQDWSTHMIGHELTALYGIDHARTLAAVLPSLMFAQKEGKREKLVQYAERVWDVTSGDDESKIATAIEYTAGFFESLGVPSRLSGYDDVRSSTPKEVSMRLKDHGMLPLGERSDIDAERVERILTQSLGA